MASPARVLRILSLVVAGILIAGSSGVAHADLPALAYLFPAGGQRGTQVQVRVGGLNLYDRPYFAIEGNGVKVTARLERMPTIWFEGPLIKQPASQQKEDYPQDYGATFQIEGDATLGTRRCRARTAQGITPAAPFVVGDLPEVVEDEQSGEPIAIPVQLPVTINGRVFPREDIDLWSFDAEANRPVQLVLASTAFGSPLEGRIEVLDPSGVAVAEATSRLRRDPMLRFTPEKSGRYTARISDIRSSGLQNHVYRLTITADPWLERCFPLGGKAGSQTKLALEGLGLDGQTVDITLPNETGPQSLAIPFQGRTLAPVWCDVDEVDEILESEAGQRIPIPGIANGRIARPGETDHWTIAARKGESLKLEVRAARLQSPLDAVLVVRDEMGKELARGDDLPNNSPDCEVAFNPPVDGLFTVEIRDRFASRGGPAFAYRLKIAPQKPAFDVTWEIDSLAIEPGKQQKVPLKLQRHGGFAGPVTIEVAGLANGVSVDPLTIPANQNQATLNLTCGENVPVSAATLRLTARGEHDGQMLEAIAGRVDPEGLAKELSLPLAITLATPFRYRGNYELKYIARGMELRKTFQIERGGFAGPLTMQLAERQGRHLQGVSGPRVVVPPEANECEYPVFLSPDMELGRTSRVNVQLIGELRDAAGESHQVGFTTNDQNEQLIALVSPSPLRLIVDPNPLLVTPGREARLHVIVKRDPTLRDPVRLELIPPAHQRGVPTIQAEVAADQEEIDLVIPVAADAGPFNASWLVRGTTRRDDESIVAQTLVKPLARP